VHSNSTTMLAVSLAFIFTGFNGYLNAKFAIFKIHHGTFIEQLLTLVGLVIFAMGGALNVWADSILLNLRKPGDRSYHIPVGAPYMLISCPNYLGEITEWCGLFVAFRSPATAAFVINTTLNLGPRAISTHRWYKEKFGDKYPKNRKAIIPFVL
jgi:steroid 5-alpha-reductase